MAQVRFGFVIVLLVTAVSGAACSPAFTSGFVNGLNRGLAGQTTGSPGFPTSPELLLFGGSGHKTFLGCLNCSKYDANAVLNPYGTHGSKYNGESIFNVYGEYGSKYSSYSACNPYATDPPVIVDREGGYYGRLSIKTYDQVRSPAIVAWIAGVCAGR